MHFDFTISLGQTVIIFTLIGGFFKLYRPFVQRQWEHDLMWDDYAERKGITGAEQVAPKFRGRKRSVTAGAD